MTQQKPTAAATTKAVESWGDWDDAAAAADRAELNRGNIFKIPEGRTVLRFLPPKRGERSPFVIFHVHYVKPAGGDKPTRVQCLQRTSSLPCPVCDLAAHLKSTGNPADFDAGKELEPQVQVFACVLVRQQEAMGVQIVSLSRGLYDKILAIKNDPDAGGNFTHPRSGFDLVVTRTGAGMGTRYTVNPARASKLCEDADLDNLLLGAPDLGEYRRKWTSGEVTAALGQDDDVAAMFEAVAPARALPPAGGQRRGGGIGGAAGKVYDGEVE